MVGQGQDGFHFEEYHIQRMKYTPDGGNVHVFTSETEDTWSIEVKDTGIGIPASEQKKSCSRCISAAAMLSIPKLPAAASDYS